MSDKWKIKLDTDQVSAVREGFVGRIHMNRPKALNSLNIQMVRAFNFALDAFEADPVIQSVVVTGEGDRAFCAGGDIRSLYESGRAGDGLATTFWREEYQLNLRISQFSKSYISIVDGLAMGGGIGVSAHGRFRIVTERAQLAMPETGIGFFPDVGTSWLLPRARGEFGTFVGLTGWRLGAGDAIEAGLADSFVLAANIPGLIEALSTTQNETVSQVIAGFSRITACELADHTAKLDSIFAWHDVEDILAGLSRDDSDFARSVHATLLAKSPLSLKVTLKLLRLGRASKSLAECLEREFAATSQALMTADFYEGIRAAVIDKDRNPTWSPAVIEHVSPNEVDAFFISASTPPKHFSLTAVPKERCK